MSLSLVCRALLPSALFLCGLLSCADQGSNLEPHGGRPAFQITDAAHNGGNGHFYFLPPLVARPNVAGEFDAGLSPVVRICAFRDGECQSQIAEFSMMTG